jgi:hypothetical protein
MYNKWSYEKMSDGFKIHIEVYVEKKEDAVMLVNRHAQRITEEIKTGLPTSTSKNYWEE